MLNLPNRKADCTCCLIIAGCRCWYSFWWDEMLQAEHTEHTGCVAYFNITIVDGDWRYRQVDDHNNHGRYCYCVFFQDNHHKIMSSYATHCIEKELA